MANLPSVSPPVASSKSLPKLPSKSLPKLPSKSLPKLPSKSLPVLPVAPRIPKRYEDYLNILPEHKDKYFSKPKTPSSSSQQSPTNSRLSPNPNNNNNPKSVGGVNLTPLISALLLAGIKLALEQKKIAKIAKASKATKTAKATKATRRRKTI